MKVRKSVVGIANTNNNAYQIKLFKKVESGTTGIENVETQPATAVGQHYNLAGQRVSGSYKGIVISNGRKYIVR